MNQTEISDDISYRPQAYKGFANREGILLQKGEAHLWIPTGYGGDDNWKHPKLYKKTRGGNGLQTRMNLSPEDNQMLIMTGIEIMMDRLDHYETVESTLDIEDKSKQITEKHQEWLKGRLELLQRLKEGGL